MGDRIGRTHLLELVRQGGVPHADAEAVIDRMLAQAEGIAGWAENFPIRRATVRRLEAAVTACCQQVWRH